jgi:hypothetical protein
MTIYTSTYRFHPFCGRFRCLWSVCGLSVVLKVQIISIYTTSYRFHPVCGHFQVSVVCLSYVCGAQSSNYVNLHFLLSFPSCLWSFSGVCGLSVVCLWYPNVKFCQFTLPPIVSTLSLAVFRCLLFVCGLSVVPKL